MNKRVRTSGIYKRSVTAMLVIASMMLGLLAPIGLQSAVAQDSASIQTRVQIMHASPDLGKVEVAINYDTKLDEFTYGKVSDWIDIQPGSNRVTITEDRAGFNYAVFDAMYPVPAGNDYYLVISDALVLTSVVDRSPVRDGMARVRVVQASVDLPTVNVKAAGQDVTFGTKLEYARPSEYTTVPAGTYDVEVTLADSGTSVLTMPGISLEGNKVYELVIIGQPDQTDHPLEIKKLEDTTNEQGGVATPSS
jgi:hypothetical protein